MATSNVAIDEGTADKRAATYSFSEDAVTKELQRVALSLNTGVEWTYGSGAIAASTPRFALATDSPGVTALGQAVMASSLPAVIASNQTGFPVFNAPTTSGGLSVVKSFDVEESAADAIKASAGQLYKLRIANFATTTRYVKLYDTAAGSVTVGTTAVIDTIIVPPGSSTNPTIITENFGGQGLAFATAISMAATTGFADNDTGAVAANEVMVSAYYK